MRRLLARRFTATSKESPTQRGVPPGEVSPPQPDDRADQQSCDEGKPQPSVTLPEEQIRERACIEEPQKRPNRWHVAIMATVQAGASLRLIGAYDEWLDRMGKANAAFQGDILDSCFATVTLVLAVALLVSDAPVLLGAVVGMISVGFSVRIARRHIRYTQQLRAGDVSPESPEA